MPVDIIDQADRDIACHMTIALREKDAVELRALRAALARIEDGTFGICERCGGNIPAKRLEIHPESAFCVSCQTVEERRNGYLKRCQEGHGTTLSRLGDIG